LAVPPLKVTYEIREDAPPPMPWPHYVERVVPQWEATLAAGGEKPIQVFLERHPALVPGAYSSFGRLKSGHAPFPRAVVTQPPLRGMESKTPDFMWISTDSGFLSPTLIELEDPNKPWVTGKGQQHHQLTEALDQIREWRRWFNDPGTTRSRR
jgi:hypothetical protein